MRYERLKRLEVALPSPIREPLRRAWRNMRGNPEERICAHLCDPGLVSVDAGAAAGGFARVLAQHSTRCEAFEANPNNWPALKAALDGLPARVHECALSDQDGEVTLRVPVVDGRDDPPLATIESHNALGGAEVRTVTVPCHRLDTLDLSPVGFMKIDVEGHELAVLRGAEGLLTRDRPNLLVEAEDRHRPGAVSDVAKYLSELGYLAYFLLGRRLKPIDEFDLAVHQNPASIEFSRVLAGRVYANNFVFVTDRAALTGLLNRSL
jgi:FkbM family methyltransferase